MGVDFATELRTEGDRRRSARVTISCGGHLSCRGQRLAIVLADLGKHGARILGSGVFKPRDRVILELVQPVKLVIGAVVVWSTNGRRRAAGLAFDLLTPEDLLLLEELQRFEGCRSG